MNWKHFVFTPRGADRAAHGITFGDDGYLFLCQRLNNGDYLLDYEVFASRPRPADRGRNVATDWTGFREAMWKYQMQHLSMPSVFSGNYQHCKEGHELRRRLLNAICREYQHPEALVDDLWAWLIKGKPEETENLIRLLVLYWQQPTQRPENRTVTHRNTDNTHTSTRA